LRSQLSIEAISGSLSESDGQHRRSFIEAKVTLSIAVPSLKRK
jgi:hypothetical protein